MNREVITNAPGRSLWRRLADKVSAGIGGTRKPHYPAPYRPREQRKADAQAQQLAKDAAQAKRDRRNAKRRENWTGRRQ